MSWFPKQSVVVPVDFSDKSFAAVDAALGMTQSPSGVHVIHILPEPPLIEADVEWQEIDVDNRARHAAEAVRQRLSDAKYGDVQIDIDFGNAGYRIAAYAERIEADLVVIPSHGRSGLKRILLGSVADRVIRLAPCPVLVLKQGP